MENIVATNQAILVSTGTSVASSSVTVQNLAVAQLTANQCVQTTLGGGLTTSGAQCGSGAGGGGSSVATGIGGTSGYSLKVSSPTTDIIFDSNTITGVLQGAATGYFKLVNTSVTLQGNSFNGASQLVQLNSSGNYPNVTASTITAQTLFQSSSNTILNGATFYANGPILFSNALTVSNSATLGASGQSVTISSNAVLSGALIANGLAGVSGQLLQSQGAGSTPIWVASTSASTALLSSTNTWTAAQIHLSSVTFSTNVVLNGGGVITVSSNTFLPNATFYQNGPVNLTAPLNFNNVSSTVFSNVSSVVIGGAGTLQVSSNTILPGTTFYQNGTEALGTVTAGTWNGTVLTSAYIPNTVAYINSSNAWTAQQTSASSFTITGLSITGAGHLNTRTTSPQASSCGASPTVTVGSSDNAGQVTEGTGSPTGCTITFGVAFTNAPFCVAQTTSTATTAAVTAISNSQFTVTTSASIPSDTINWVCVGRD